jgi:serine/threonine-protein kinase
VLYRQPNRPSELVDVPADVELVLALGLAKRPEARFGRALDMAHALRDAASGRLEAGERGLSLLLREPWETAAAA